MNSESSPSVLLQAVLPAQEDDDWLELAMGYAEVLACEYHNYRKEKTDANSAAFSTARADLLAHLAARPQEQPKPNTEAAHLMAPVGTDLPPALSEDTRDAARLDWLLANHLQWIPGKWNSSGRWDLYWETEESDLRAAIDAALAAQPKDAA